MSWLWQMVAWVVTRPRVKRWLIERSMRTPYSHIRSRDGKSDYMRRFWLFNPYGKTPDGKTAPARWSWLPSIRVHHILLADDDEHLHDHPWDARTIILDGWYIEEYPGLKEVGRPMWMRPEGHTAPLLFGEYHRIEEVSPGGAWTLFFTWGYQGTWGFDVDGVKVPYYEYLDERDSHDQN